MGDLTESELALFNTPTQTDDWGWDAKEPVQALVPRPPTFTPAQTLSEPQKAAPERFDTAAVIPPDAPANDATLPPPEKKRGRKPKAESAPVAPAPVVQVTPAPVAPAPVYVPSVANLRDQFAMEALNGMRPSLDPEDGEADQYARTAYVYADAMIRARGP